LQEQPHRVTSPTNSALFPTGNGIAKSVWETGRDAMNEEQANALAEAMCRLSMDIGNLVRCLESRADRTLFIKLNGTILHLGSISSAHYHRGTHALDIRWTNGSRDQFTGKEAEALWRALERHVAATTA
jgi:hypothetical protein